MEHFIAREYKMSGRLYSMEKALLVVSFGTSHAETRRRTIEAIEADLQAAFPERRLYRAWTSGFLRKKLRSLRPFGFRAGYRRM